MVTVSRGVRASRDERRAAIAGRMLDPVERLLSEGFSFAEVSVNRLCREIGIARTTFYAAFDDKSDLLGELTGGVLKEVGEIAEDWFSRAPAATQGELEAISLRVFKGFREHELLLTAVAQAAAYDPAVDAGYRATFTDFASQLEKLVADGRESDGEGREFPSSEIAQMLIWMFERTCNQMARGADDETLRRLARSNAWIVWSALRGPDDPAV